MVTVTGFVVPLKSPPQPENVLIEAESAQEVRTLLYTLPADYRIALILKYWYAMSYQEIAQTLKTTVGAIKSKLFRARKMMADKSATANTVTTSQGAAPRRNATTASSRIVFNSFQELAQLEIVQ